MHSTDDDGFDPNGDLVDDGFVDEADLALARENLGHTVTPFAPPKLLVEEASGEPNDNVIELARGESAEVVIRNDGERELAIAALQLCSMREGDAATEPQATEAIAGIRPAQACHPQSAFGLDVLDHAKTTGFVLLAGEAQIVTVTLAPNGSDPAAAELRFWHNDRTQTSPQLIKLGEQARSATAPSAFAGLHAKLRENLGKHVRSDDTLSQLDLDDDGIISVFDIGALRSQILL